MKMPEGAGGTSGGIGMFFIGFLMSVGGLYMVARNVIVHSSWGGFTMWGAHIPFGLTLLPLLIAVAVLFYNARSVVGWVLFAVGLVILIAEVLMSLEMNFRPVTLYEVIIMLGLFFGGVGLMLRSFKGGKPAE